jgi:hypothetical protein
MGRVLSVPEGFETAHITIVPTMTSFRFSLRTRDPSEAKMRQAAAVLVAEQF